MKIQNGNGNGEDGSDLAIETGAERSVHGELSDEAARVWKLEGFGDLPLTMSVPVVGRHLGVSKSTAYNMCKAGTIRARHFGSRMSVTRHELFRLLHGPDSPTTTA